MGLLLYILSLLAESLSAWFRYWVGTTITTAAIGGSPELGQQIGLVLALTPAVWSLAALCGLTSGHLLTRRELGARTAKASEQAAVQAILPELGMRPGVTLPRHWYVLDVAEPIAYSIGRTLYLGRNLFETEILRPVLAHQLGHLNSSDSRLVLALRRLVFIRLFELARALMGINERTWLEPTLRYRQRKQFSFFSGTLAILLLLFSGGLGLGLCSVLWTRYWAQRESQADLYAERLTPGQALASALRHISLLDIAAPFMRTQEQPQTRQRIKRLTHS